MLRRKRLVDFTSKLPFSVFAVFAYWINFVSLLLWILVLPIVIVYRFGLSVAVWLVIPKRGQYVVVVGNGIDDSNPWLRQILPTIRDRALFLNYEDRHSWSRWSLSVRVFHAFGPKPMPSWIPRCLPSIIVVKKFRVPKQYSFGALYGNQKEQSIKLSKELTSE